MHDFVTISPESLTIRHNPSGKVVKSKLQIEIIPCITVYNADTQTQNLVKSLGMTGFLCSGFNTFDLDTKLDKLFQCQALFVTNYLTFWRFYGFFWDFPYFFPLFCLYISYLYKFGLILCRSLAMTGWQALGKLSKYKLYINITQCK